MTFDLVYFLPAIGLLWLSLPLSFGKGKGSTSRARTPNVPLRGVLTAWQNWVDLVRAGVGVYVLKELSIGLEPSRQEEASTVLLAKTVVLSIGVLIQTVRSGPGLTFVAPIFYLSGMTLMLPGYTEGAFAFLFAWAFTCGTKDPKFHLPIMALALAAAGYCLGGLSQALLFNCALVLLPAFFALFWQRVLLFVFRESKGPRAHAAKTPSHSSPGASAPPGANLAANSGSTTS